MNLITWNCNMAYRKKADSILSLQPDIAVISECECPERLKFGLFTQQPTYMIWWGDNPNKGLGIFSYSDYRFKLHDWHNPAFKTILPSEVTGGHCSFTLFAIWACKPLDNQNRYIRQIWMALNYYNNLVAETRTILIGDFNSNKIWDRKRREGNHSDVVSLLAKKGIHSVYHQFYNQPQGKETHPTLFLLRDKEKPYHIDYCFASSDFVEEVTNVDIGSYADWIGLSDHMPLIITFGDIISPNYPENVLTIL